MDKFTKIVATISDRRCDVEFLRELHKNGMNVVRMNSAHLQLKGFKKIVENVRAVSSSIGILMDTKGPEIRTTVNKGDEEIEYRPGDKVVFTGNPDGLTEKEHICLSYPDIAVDLRAGAHILIDDGELSFIVDDIQGGEILATAENSGALGSRKSVNIPFIAHSFVRSANDVRDIKRMLDERGSHIKIISKIENQEGIDNFDEILEESYGIMIARGDLGIEVAAERIPVIQNELINKCVAAHKPVIVATQMLHSMINNPRPTRAEVSDIAHAVTQHADALMLSGETAYGKYPVEAISTMSRVASEMEHALSGSRPTPALEADVTSFLARQAVKSTCLLGTKAILTDSYTGRTARYISSYRASYPTLAICYHQFVVRLLALSYGVEPIYQPRMKTTRVYLQNALTHLIEGGRLTKDDKIAYLGGSFGEGHGTSFLEINSVEAIMENFNSYTIPNLEDASTQS
jgi:pyruvate kinase